MLNSVHMGRPRDVGRDPWVCTPGHQDRQEKHGAGVIKEMSSSDTKQQNDRMRGKALEEEDTGLENSEPQQRFH